VAGRLIKAYALSGFFLHHEEFSILLDHRSHGDIGLPDHGVFLKKEAILSLFRLDSKKTEDPSANILRCRIENHLKGMPS
jgi:hypothetical protein